MLGSAFFMGKCSIEFKLEIVEYYLSDKFFYMETFKKI
jgi:hypothetical protein